MNSGSAHRFNREMLKFKPVDDYFAEAWSYCSCSVFVHYFGNTVVDVNGRSASERIHWNKKETWRYDPTYKGLDLLAPEMLAQEAALTQRMVIVCNSIQLKLQGKVTKT